MEGNDIEDLGGGSFRTVGAVQRYSLLDQYAMGLVAERDVPPFFYVENPTNIAGDATRESAPQVGVTFNGTRRDVPDPGHHRHPRPADPAGGRRASRGPPAGVHLPRQRRPDRRSDGQVAKLDRIRRAWEAFFLQATDRPHAGGHDASLAATGLFPARIQRAILGRSDRDCRASAAR